MQILLDAAQSADNNRVTFVPVGTAEDGFTSAIIEIYDNSTGITIVSDEATTTEGTNNEDTATATAAVTETVTSSASKLYNHNQQKRKTFSLRMGVVSLLSSICEHFG